MPVVKKWYAVYIITNRRNGTLYTGMTGGLIKRMWQHRHEWFDGFSKRYGLKLLAYYELHEDAEAAIRREKQIKAGSRHKKTGLIEELNPEWRDLSEPWFDEDNNIRPEFDPR